MVLLATSPRRLLWEYKRDIPPEIARQNGNFGAKRNIAMVDDKLIVATTDSHIIALDMKTGKLIWDHEVEDYKKGWRYTGGPLVASNVIVQGMTACGNAMPGGCFITGHDINTGKELVAFMKAKMPPDRPGSLTDQSYAELTAFLLDANDYPKGDKELPPDTPSQQAMSLKRSQ
jgi:outer membrane protein assembly factor BamB